MISFVIPAHNEETLLGETLRILRASAEQLGEPFEIIVVDDASTDRTADVARDAGALVERVEKRHIAATRNAGAKLARGDTLVFVDADTHVPPRTLELMRDALRAGAVGGGARYRFTAAPLWTRIAGNMIGAVLRLRSWAAGCFVFARRDAFEAVGGFDERYFAAEELVLSQALKRRGRMVIVEEPVLTSGRKAHLYTIRESWEALWRIVIGGRGALKRRDQLTFWYDGRR
ncbi:MAG: glycosyltransferase [Gemmatimonadaceae bacterium]